MNEPKICNDKVIFESHESSEVIESHSNSPKSVDRSVWLRHNRLSANTIGWSVPSVKCPFPLELKKFKSNSKKFSFSFLHCFFFSALSVTHMSKLSTSLWPLTNALEWQKVNYSYRAHVNLRCRSQCIVRQASMQLQYLHRFYNWKSRAQKKWRNIKAIAFHFHFSIEVRLTSLSRF